MSINYEDRLKELDYLDVDIKESNKKLMSILNRFAWDEENILKHGKYITCPINPGHSIPDNKLDTHVESCRLRSEGYKEDDLLFPDSYMPPSAPCAIVIDKDLQNEIIREKLGKQGIEERPVPQSLDRTQTDFTTDERLAIYEHVLQNTKVERVEDIDMSLHVHKEDKPSGKLYLQELAEKRDLKRRRTKYRKPVGQGYKEELKSAINLQMEMLEEWVSGKSTNEKQKKQLEDEEKYNEYKRSNDRRHGSEYSSYSGSFPRERVHNREENRKSRYDHNRDTYGNWQDGDSYSNFSQKRHRDEFEKTSQKHDKWQEKRDKYGECSRFHEFSRGDDDSRSRREDYAKHGDRGHYFSEEKRIKYSGRNDSSSGGHEDSTTQSNYEESYEKDDKHRHKSKKKRTEEDVDKSRKKHKKHKKEKKLHKRESS